MHQRIDRRFHTCRNTHGIQDGGPGMHRSEDRSPVALDVRGNADVGQEDQADNHGVFHHAISLLCHRDCPCRSVIAY